MGGRQKGHWYDARALHFATPAEARAYWWSRLLDVAGWTLLAIFVAGLLAGVVTAILWGDFANNFDHFRHPRINPSPSPFGLP